MTIIWKTTMYSYIKTKLVLHKIKKAYINGEYSYFKSISDEVADNLEEMGFYVSRASVSWISWKDIDPFPNTMTVNDKYEVKKAKSIIKAVKAAKSVQSFGLNMDADYQLTKSIQYVLNIISEASARGDSYCIIFKQLSKSQMEKLAEHGFRVSTSSNNFWKYRIQW